VGLLFVPLAVACGALSKSTDPADHAKPSPVKPAASADKVATGQLITEIELDTKPGLSGLAADEKGRLWTVAERDEVAYRITLDSQLKPTIEVFPIVNVPADTDLEAMEELGDGKFAFGTEGRGDSSANIMLAELKDHGITMTSTIKLAPDEIGLQLANNHGAEGLCGAGGTLIVGIEEVGVAKGKRWAPILRVTDGKLVRRHRLWLTSTTGKISALDCTIAKDGSARVWAIERHFEVSRILTFTLPPPGQGDEDITPRIAMDLGPTMRPHINLEGIAELPDGRIAAVNDNQYTSIDGPSFLFVFRAGGLSFDAK
jgi:hypothetical protein